MTWVDSGHLYGSDRDALSQPIGGRRGLVELQPQLLNSMLALM